MQLGYVGLGNMGAALFRGSSIVETSAPVHRGQPAFEAYEDHGVFTRALLGALKNGDHNGNGYIE